MPVRSWALSLLLGTIALPGCLSEVIIDNYSDEVQGGGSAGDASDDDVETLYAGGSTSYITSSGIGSAYTYSTPAPVSSHESPEAIVNEVAPASGYLPLLVTTPNDTVLFVAPPTSGGGFILKEYDANSSTPLRTLSISAEPAPTALTVASDGGVYLAGPLTDVVTVSKGYYIAKLNADWDYEWGFDVTTTSSSSVAALAVDDASNLYVGTHFDSGPFELSAYDSGLHQILRVVPDGGGIATLRELNLSPSGSLLLSGSFIGNATLGAYTLSTTQDLGWYARADASTGAFESVATSSLLEADTVTAYRENQAGELYWAASREHWLSEYFPLTPILRKLDSSMTRLWQANLGSVASLDSLDLDASSHAFVAGRIWPTSNPLELDGMRLYVAEISENGENLTYDLSLFDVASRPWLTVTSGETMWVSYFYPVTGLEGETDNYVLLMRYRKRAGT